MKIAEAFVELRVDGKKAEGEVKSQGRKLGETFAQVFGAAAFGLGIKKAIDAGSRLEQSVGAIEAVFGSATKSIDAWAKASAKSMGLSEAASREALSLIGAQLKNFGFSIDQAADKGMELVELGADLAATFGGTTTEAVQALTAALRGEMDPIERYGVSLNDARLKAKALELGLYDGKGALDANAKAQASLAVIMEQTASASGQFARELDTVAGKQAVATAEAENSAASLGQALAPVYERLVDAVGMLARGFESAGAPIQIVTVALLGMVALAGPIGKSVQLARDLTGALKGMSPAARGAAAAAGALAAAIVALDVVNRLTADAGQATDAMNEFLATTQDTSFGSNEGVAELANSFVALAKETGESQGVVSKTFDVLSAGLEDGNVQANLLGEQMEETFRTLMDVDPSKAFDVAMALSEVADSAAAGSEGAIEFMETYGLTAEMIDGFATSAENAAIAQQALTGPAGDAAAEVQKQADAAAAATKANQTLKTALDPVWDAFSETAQAAEDLQKAIDAIFAPTRNMDEAAEGLAAAVDDVAASFKENGRTLDMNTDKGRANRKAVREQADEIIRFTTTMVANGASTRDAAKYANALTGQLSDQLVALGLTREEADGYIATLGLTPENIETAVDLANEETTKAKLGEMLDQLGDIDAGAAAEIQALIEEGKYMDAERRLNDIARSRGVKLNVSLSGGGQVSISGVTGGQMYRVVASAEGNVFDRPTMSLFGEAGAEAILPLERPRALSRILADPRVAGPVAAAMGGESVSGGGVQIGTVNVGSRSDYDELAERLDRLAWRIAT